MAELGSFDRVTRLEPGSGATALRNIPQTLTVFETHFPRFAVLPGVMLLASIVELGRHFLREETGRGWALASLEGARFRRYARPGDQLEIVVTRITIAEGGATLAGSIRADGHVIVDVRRLRFTGPLEAIA
jgi:3-hydroxyacyl-[acyl-carrier-protein] dehydratase